MSRTQPKQHLSPSLADYDHREPVRPELAEQIAEAAALQEREFCKRDACMHCAGRSNYKRVPVGPNAAGNYEHEPPDFIYARERPQPVLCLASAIYAREAFERNRRDATEGRQIHLQDVDIAELQERLSIPMILWCPACGLQHVDKPQPEKQWDNPPHRSHECQGCGFVWRPADVPTVGVEKIKTRGKADTQWDKRPVGFESGSLWLLPWDIEALRDWSICGMNHYWVMSTRHLFVVMTRAERVIKAEGSSEVSVFLRLKEQALRMNQVIAGENR